MMIDKIIKRLKLQHSDSKNILIICNQKHLDKFKDEMKVLFEQTQARYMTKPYPEMILIKDGITFEFVLNNTIQAPIITNRLFYFLPELKDVQ